MLTTDLGLIPMEMLPVFSVRETKQTKKSKHDVCLLYL